MDRPKKPRFNNIKNNHLQKMEDYYYFVWQTKNVLDFATTKSDGSIKEFLHKHIVIDLVTLIESISWENASVLINMNKLKPSQYIKNYCPPEVIYGNKKFNETELALSTVNFQNPDAINELFSNICKINFFETIKEIVRLKTDEPDVIEYDFWEFPVVPEKLYINWKNFIQMFKKRNSFVHNAISNSYYNKIELYTLIDNSICFVRICSIIGEIINEINHPTKDELGFSDQPVIMGIKTEKVIHVIKNQIKNYVP